MKTYRVNFSYEVNSYGEKRRKYDYEIYTEWNSEKAVEHHRELYSEEFANQDMRIESVYISRNGRWEDIEYEG